MLFHIRLIQSSLIDDCIRLSLIECQSFPNCKINIDPTNCVLMFLPCVMQVLCTTWYIQINLFRILMLLEFGINGKILFVFCLNSDLQVSIHCCLENED